MQMVLHSALPQKCREGAWLAFLIPLSMFMPCTLNFDRFNLLISQPVGHMICLPHLFNRYLPMRHLEHEFPSFIQQFFCQSVAVGKLVNYNGKQTFYNFRGKECKKKPIDLAKCQGYKTADSFCTQ